jgi:hypothetical protein
MADKVDEEVELLRHEIRRLGKAQDNGEVHVTFGTVFNDDRCANLFEALLGTLRAAKKRGVVDFPGQLLLQGTHDHVVIRLLK